MEAGRDPAYDALDDLVDHTLGVPIRVEATEGSDGRSFPNGTLALTSSQPIPIIASAVETSASGR